MRKPNFYQILGLGRAASADEIRSAYRALVKKYHPDLFTEPGEKAAASERLRLINEAYTVLGNTRRRGRYDQELGQKPQAPSPAADGKMRRKTSRSPSRAEPRSATQKVRKARLHFPISRKWTGYSFAAAVAGLAFIFAAWSKPRLTTEWILVEKVEHSSPSSFSPSTNPGGDWSRIGEYASGSECAGTLKERVRQDEREGSATVRDEQNGTMAITVLVRKGVRYKPNAGAEGAALAEQKDIAKRVRTLECRQMQRVKMESWFRRALRTMAGTLLG